MDYYEQFLKALEVIKDEAFKQGEDGLGAVLETAISRLYYLGENVNDVANMRKAMGDK